MISRGLIVEMSGSKSSRDLSYVILRPDQLPDVHRLLYESFLLDEPMTSHLQLCQVCERNIEISFVDATPSLVVGLSVVD